MRNSVFKLVGNVCQITSSNEVASLVLIGTMDINSINILPEHVDGMLQIESVLKMAVNVY